ncbi:MAG TPA: hypothetical protein PKC28_05240 [Bdellovibrionales bacterium]|nr:hypothetical protein [Bdellovibrionales bacterium]
MFRAFTLIAAACLAFPAHAKILREDIGELRIHDLLIRPEFKLKEPTHGSFTIGDSSFALRWELEQKYAGVIRIGPRTLLNPTARYELAVPDDVTLVEAFGEYNNPYGRVRLGRIPVEWGIEGAQWERELIFPRSLLFKKRAMMLRDVGGSYEIAHNGYFTGFVIHNGESDSDTDGRIWYSAKWGYRTDAFQIGLNGQTGGTKPIATSTSTDTLAGVDPAKESLWRIGGVNMAWHRKKFEWVLEFYAGEREQETMIGKFATGHSDLNYQFSKIFSGHLRYDQFDPNLKTPGDLERELSLALVLSNATRSSNLILVGTKVLEQGSKVNNDEIRLIWSLSPSGVVRF